MILWVPITVGAAAFQVARNAAQRSLLSAAGPWGATLVRFLFGVPFSLAFAGAARLASPTVHLTFSPRWLVACLVGALAQIGATAALLVCMRRSSFALGSVLQQSSIPLAALVGLALGERLAPTAWLGLAIVTTGLGVLGWPRRGAVVADWTPALLGLAAGTGFAIASNAYRQAALSLSPGHPFLTAQVTVFTVQAIQSAAMVAVLLAADRRALVAALRSWRTSIGAGLFGAAASGLWFTAFAMAPAGPVRAVGAVEIPLAAMAGRGFLAERMAPWRLAVALVTAVGLVMAAVGGKGA